MNQRPASPAPLRVFISSTLEDLRPYREAAFRAIHGIGAYSDDMAHWPADDRDAATLSADRVRDCDAVILILAHRYGVPQADSGVSITELEYRAARDQGIPVLAFFVDDNVPWPPAFVDRVHGAELARFKQEVEGDVTRRTFRSPDELNALVTQALVAFEERRDAERGAATSPASAEAVLGSPPAPLPPPRGRAARPDVRRRVPMGLIVAAGLGAAGILAWLVVPLVWKDSGGGETPRVSVTRITGATLGTSPARVMVTAMFEPVQLPPSQRLFLVATSDANCKQPIGEGLVDHPLQGDMRLFLLATREQVGCAQLVIKDANGARVHETPPMPVSW